MYLIQKAKFLFSFPAVQTFKNYSLRCNPFAQFNTINKKERVDIIINEKDLEWKQTRGGGPGGQATNKTNNCILLTHKPTGIFIKCHDSRDTETNKHYAIKRLKEKLDEEINGELSLKSLEIKKRQKQKDTKRRKSQKKYQKSTEEGSSLDQSSDESENSSKNS